MLSTWVLLVLNPRGGPLSPAPCPLSLVPCPPAAALVSILAEIKQGLDTRYALNKGEAASGTIEFFP